MRRRWVQCVVVGLAFTASGCGDSSSGGRRIDWRAELPSTLKTVEACSQAFTQFERNLAHFQVLLAADPAYQGPAAGGGKRLQSEERRAFELCDFDRTIEVLTAASEDGSGPLRSAFSRCVEDLSDIRDSEVLLLRSESGGTAEWEAANSKRAERYKTLRYCAQFIPFTANRAGFVAPIQPAPTQAQADAYPTSSPTPSESEVADGGRSERKIPCQVSLDGKPLFTGNACLVQESQDTIWVNSETDGCVATIRKTADGFSGAVMAYRNACAQTDIDSSGVELGAVVPPAALAGCWTGERLEVCID